MEFYENIGFLRELFLTLDRGVAIQPLPALIDNLEGGLNSSSLDISKLAVGIDSSAFLRIASHNKGEDLIDYFSANHKGPLILPGQTIQEFWNNELSAVDTVSKILDGSFKKFKTDIDKLDHDFEDLKYNLQGILDSFQSDHGHVYSHSTVRKTLSLMQTLNSRARIPFAPRSYFSCLAKQRQMTKTPPGFKDSGDGDFFVWVDFLFGLKQAKDEGEIFERAILVTNDTKIDWGRPGLTHPILVAEAHAFLGVPFETWTLTKFAEKVFELEG